MTGSTESFGVARRQGWARSGVVTALRHALGWPARVYRARQLMHQLGRLDDAELRDIGLTRQDLRDARGLSLDADPSVALRRRAEERRRRP